MVEHHVQFYDDEAHFAGLAAGFIRAGLLAGDAVVAVVTPARRAELDKLLCSDIARCALRYPAAEQYRVMDAAATLARFMRDGRVDETLFAAQIDPILQCATQAANGRVRVFGEMVNVISALHGHESAIQIEEMWNTVGRHYSMSLMCGYPMGAFGRAADGEVFLHICNAHSRVSPAESYTPPANAHEHYRAIAVLQQKARALETELSLREEKSQVAGP